MRHFIRLPNWNSLRRTMCYASDLKDEVADGCSTQEEYDECCDDIDDAVTYAIIENCERYCNDVLGVRLYSVTENDSVRSFAYRLNNNWQRYLDVLKTSGSEAAELDYVFNLYGQYLRSRERIYRGEVGNHHLMAASESITDELVETDTVAWRNFENAMSLKDFLEKVGKYKIVTKTVNYTYNRVKSSYRVNYVYSKNGTWVGIHLRQDEFSKYMKGAWKIDIREVTHRRLKPDDVLFVLNTNEKIVIMNVNEVKLTNSHNANHSLALSQALNYQGWYKMISIKMEEIIGEPPIVKYRMIFSEKFVDSNSDFKENDMSYIVLLKENDIEYTINKLPDIEKYGIHPNGRGWINGETN